MEAINKYKYQIDDYLDNRDWFLSVFESEDKAEKINCNYCSRHQTKDDCDACVHTRNLFNYEEWDKKYEQERF